MALIENCIAGFKILVFVTLFNQYACQIRMWPSAGVGYFLPPMSPISYFPQFSFPTFPSRPGVGFPNFPAWVPNVPIDTNDPITNDIPVEPEDYSARTDNVNKTRVVGGRNATEGEIPYQVSLRTRFSNHNCGGCLINDQWVLTAAHCIPMASRVTMGSIHVDHGGISRNIAKSIKHPQYTQAQRLNDIALIKLDSPVEFNDFIKPLALPENDIEQGALCTLTGWGFTSYPNLASPSVLQVLKVRLIANEDCGNKWKPYDIHPINICTEAPTGKGSCKGDSGGPLMYGNELAGIVSFGAPCALGFPDVYTNVYLYKSWITDTINANADLKIPFDQLDG